MARQAEESKAPEQGAEQNQAAGQAAPETQPQDGAAGDGAAAPQGQDGGQPQDGAAGEAPSASDRLFDGVEQGGKDGGQAAPQTASAEDYLKEAGVDGDVTVRVGDRDVTLPAGEASAIAPALRAAGVAPAQARKVMEVFAALGDAREQGYARASEAAANAKAEAAMRELGPDYRRTVAEALRGGRELFGDELWREFQDVKPLLCDVRFIRALARYGHAMAIDNGGPSQTPGAARGGGLEFDLSSFARGTAD